MPGGEAVVVSLDVASHYEALLAAMLDADGASEKSPFDKVEQIMRKFWGGVKESPRKMLGEPAAVTAMIEADTAFYEDLLQKLMPDVFAKIEAGRTKQIRSFAKQVDHWVVSALEGYPIAFVEARQRLALEFGQRLRRYTGLNHLVQAANAVLENAAHVRQMVDDFDKVDMSSVAEQLHAICPTCSREAIQAHEAAFREFHETTSGSLDAWAHWLQGVVETCMGPYESDEQYHKVGSELLLRWSFVSSLVVRDLTLRSAASFGPFHLMRLLCDEYVYYLVEAAQRGRTPRPHTTAAPTRDEGNDDDDDNDDDDEGDEQGGGSAAAAAVAPPAGDADVPADSGVVPSGTSQADEAPSGESAADAASAEPKAPEPAVTSPPLSASGRPKRASVGTPGSARKRHRYGDD